MQLRTILATEKYSVHGLSDDCAVLFFGIGVYQRISTVKY